MQRKDRAKQVDQQHQKAEGATADDRAGVRRPAERSEGQPPSAAPPPTGKQDDV